MVDFNEMSNANDAPMRSYVGCCPYTLSLSLSLSHSLSSAMLDGEGSMFNDSSFFISPTDVNSDSIQP